MGVFPSVILYDDIRETYIEYDSPGVVDDIHFGLTMPDPIIPFIGSYEDCVLSACGCSGSECGIRESGGDEIYASARLDKISLLDVNINTIISVVQSKTRQHLCKEMCKFTRPNSYIRKTGHCEESFRITKPDICRLSAWGLGFFPWLTDGNLTVSMNSDMPNGCTLTDASNAFLNIGSEATECSDAHPCICSNADTPPYVFVENDVTHIKNEYDKILCN